MMENFIQKRTFGKNHQVCQKYIPVSQNTKLRELTSCFLLRLLMFEFTGNIPKEDRWKVLLKSSPNTFIRKSQI